MSENKTVDQLHDDLLSNISDSYQKTEGFPTWDILKAFAIGLKKLWDKAFDIESKLDVNNLIGEDLERFVFQRKGVSRKSATKSVGKIRIVTGEGTINEGDLFATEKGIQFRATETVQVSEGSFVNAEAIVGGENGNVASNTVTTMPITLTGISTITNDDPFIDGYDEESDDALRERYLEALREPATSGNVYHYKRWAKEVEGVGDAKVFGLWAGDNTVQVVIIDSDKVVPSDETVARVQNYIDPDIAGSGEGEAPVGAYCTVSPATAFPINVNVTLSIPEGLDVDAIRDDIETGVIAYLKSIAFQSNYVSIAKIGDIILDVDGVEDYVSLKINNQTSRLAIPEKSVAILGEVIANVADE